jgi:hypothetical protein
MLAAIRLPGWSYGKLIDILKRNISTIPNFHIDRLIVEVELRRMLFVSIGGKPAGFRGKDERRSPQISELDANNSRPNCMEHCSMLVRCCLWIDWALDAFATMIDFESLVTD